MTEHIQYNTDSPLINMLFQYGLSEGMPKIAELIVNTAMLLDRSQQLQALSHQRSPERTGYANGFKNKSLHPSMGKLDLHIPQVINANSPFYPSLLKKARMSISLSNFLLLKCIFREFRRERFQKFFRSITAWMFLSLKSVP